jgi:hypothetical protein
VLRARATQRSVFGFAGSKLSVLLVSRFLPASKVCLWCGSQHRPKHFNESTYTVVTQRGLERVVEDGIACAVGKIGEHDGVLDTQVQSLWLAAIQAQVALDKRNPAAALNAVQASVPIELGGIQFVNNTSCLYHVYIHGEAYLAATRGESSENVRCSTPCCPTFVQIRTKSYARAVCPHKFSSSAAFLAVRPRQLLPFEMRPLPKVLILFCQP